MAQAVAGVGIGLVRLVRDPALPKGGADRFGLGPGQAEQRAAVHPRLGRMPRAVQPGAPGQPQQQRFGLVICSMGRCDGIYPLFQQAQSRHSAGGGPSPPRRGAAATTFGQFCRVEHPQRHPQPGAGLPAQRLRPGRRLRRAGRGSHGRPRGCSRTSGCSARSRSSSAMLSAPPETAAPAAAAAPGQTAGPAGQSAYSPAILISSSFISV